MSFIEFNTKDLEKSKTNLKNLLKNKRKQINNLLKIKDKSYQNFVLPFQEIGEHINEFITPIFHIDSVKNSNLTNKVCKECLPILVKYENEISMNVNIYNTLKDIHYKYNSILSNIQIKVLENEIRNFELSGCNLSLNKKNQLEKINLELEKLSHEFSKNILDSNNKFEMVLSDIKDIKKIPKSDLNIAKFEEEGITKYKFTLHTPSYFAYITYGTNRQKREELYKAYSTRANKNGKLIEKILLLKHQKAKILGFKNYAQYSLSTKMAKNEDEVILFLKKLVKKTKFKAKKELKEVKKIALKDGVKDFTTSDFAYYSQILKESKYNLDEEFYRPYFEQKSVLNGFFSFLEDMFDINFKKVDTNTWDEKVLVYDINENNKAIARIYFDLEARKDKKGGAWMNNWHTYYKNSNGKINLPTAFIVCNFPPSKNTTPSLLKHSDVVTLFHEMGHAIHHLFSKIEEPFISGISGVSWDTVEFPSQFLEYFAYEKDVLRKFARHYETGEVLSDESIEKIIVSRNFQSSISCLRQVEFALFDFIIHKKLYKNEILIQYVLDKIRNKVSVLKPPSYNKFQNGFSHIFSGGYSAGYYSYKWAEVLSADAFFLFKASENIINKELAKRYKDTILSKGGSKNMDELFFDFAKRNPNVDSLLKIDGIIS